MEALHDLLQTLQLALGTWMVQVTRIIIKC